MTEQLKATKVYEGAECSHYRFGKYRVTTYPFSKLIWIALWDKTSKRVVGRHIEAAARIAIAQAQGST